MTPAGTSGGTSPACASTKAPVPSVTLAAPGAQQRRPNSEACWSPSAARTGMPAIVASMRSQSTIGGSSARGMPNSASSSSSQSSPPSAHSSERAALPASQTRAGAGLADGAAPEAGQEPARHVAGGEPVRAADVVEQAAQLRGREGGVELE